MQKKQKRFYKVNEIVWVIDKKKEGKINHIDKDNLEVTVSMNDGEELVLKLWEIDKLKYSAKENLLKLKKKNYTTNLYIDATPTVYFAKVRDEAIVPSKRDEDAGYDVYACLDSKSVADSEGKKVYELWIPAFKTTLVPTGIAMALPKTHYFNLKHERGSTGKVSMSVLAGVVDSGYRGEIFVAMTPLYKDVLITSEVSEVEELDNVILYPYSKAICQGTIDLVPKVKIKEIPFEDLKNIESERGDTKLGQSGK